MDGDATVHVHPTVFRYAMAPNPLMQLSPPQRRVPMPGDAEARRLVREELLRLTQWPTNAIDTID